MRIRALPTFLVVAASCIALSGCVSTSFHPSKNFETRAQHPVAAGSVAVLRSAPSRPYETLGEIEAWISGFLSSEAVLRRVCEAAAAVGADAIINTGRGHLFAMPSANEGESVSPRTVSFTVTAIRYRLSADQKP